MKIMHIADEHWEQSKLDRCLASSRFIEEQVAEIKPDLIVLAGDLQNRRQALAETSAVNPMFEHIRQLASVAPIATVYGNAEHDAPGSLDVLRNLRTVHPIYLTAGAESVGFVRIAGVSRFCDVAELAQYNPTDSTLLLHLFSYPTKARFLAGAEATSVDESSRVLGDAIRKIFMGFGVLSQGVKCPVVFVGHLNVSGALLSTGQTLISQDIMVSHHDLELSGADYYALGHIHKAQAIAGREHIRYAGSIYHTNFGEVEDKSFFSIVTGVEKDMPIFIDRYVIPSRPLSLHEAEWDPQSGWSDEQTENDWTGADLRIRVSVSKECASLITDEQIQGNYPGAATYQIDRIVLPQERIRSSSITKAATLAEKIAEWGRVTNQEIPEQVYVFAADTERTVNQ